MSSEALSAIHPSWLEPILRGASAEQFVSQQIPMDGSARHSAVLILFAGDTAAGADVLLLQRASTLRSHAGQMAFPGGATDPEDLSASATALREAAEEVGLIGDTATVLAELPPLFLAPSRFIVTPVLAFWSEPHEVGVLDTAEVAAVARVALADLVDPANRFSVSHPSGYLGPGFEVDGLFIWGFTAGLLDTLLRLGGLEVDWDRTVHRDVLI